MPPPTPKDQTTLEIGQRFGHSKQFTITKLLGRGGFGEVYLANEERAQRNVAIKVMRPEHNGNDALLRRFHGEYTLANLLSHPSLVKMIDLAETREGIHYIAMEYLEGVLLSARMLEYEQKQGQLGLQQTLIVGWQIASVLAQLHARNIIHRDLKPGNLMLVKDPDVFGGERVKLLDFGIAKLTDVQRAKALSVDFNTSTKDHLGTPAFMAPEIFKKSIKPGAEADVYALGCILYRCLAGNYPFSGETDVEVIMKHMTETPIPIKDEDPSISPEIASLIDGMLAKDPAARPTMATIGARFGAALGVSTGAAGQVIIRSSSTELNAVLADLSTGNVSVTQDAPVPVSSGEQPVLQAGQQITTTQTRSSRIRRRTLLGISGAVGILALGSVAGLLSLRQRDRAPATQPNRAPATSEQPAPAPKQAAPAVASPVAAPPPATSEAMPPASPTEPKTGKSKCEPVEPDAACIQGALSPSDRSAFIKALGIADVKLCPGDYLTVVGRPQVNVTKSKGVPKSKKEEFVYSLHGSPTKLSFSGEVIIRCGKGK